MKNRVGKSVVPAHLVAGLIRDWAQNNEYALNSESNGWGDNNFCGGIVVLANQSGISVRRISDILSDRENSQRVCTFDTADKLLCAMGMTSEWHSTLAEYYGPFEVASYERHLESGVAA